MSEGADATLVVPGTRLCAERDAACGSGVYARQGSVYASLLGRKVLAEGADGRPVVSVVGRAGTTSAAAPQIGAVAMARITRITSRAATASIVCVDDAPLAEPFVGIIRYALTPFLLITTAAAAVVLTLALCATARRTCA